MTAVITCEYSVSRIPTIFLSSIHFFPLKVGNTAILLSVVKSDLKMAHLKVEGSFCH